MLFPECQFSLHLEGHESPVLEKQQKGAEYDKPTYPCDYKDPFECTRVIKQGYCKIHAENPCHHPKNSNNKCCSCE